MQISVAINSRNPVEGWLRELLRTSVSFDEVVLYLDGFREDSTFVLPNFTGPKEINIIADGKERSIADGFNHVVCAAKHEWVCPFCDDDYFAEKNVELLIHEMKHHGFADDADIIHFPVLLSNGGQWGNNPVITMQDLERENRLPHGSFIRKAAFEKLGGYAIDEAADWNLWLRAAKAGLRFKYWPEPVYVFRQGHERSAWRKQVREIGTEEIKRRVLANA